MTTGSKSSFISAWPIIVAALVGSIALAEVVALAAAWHFRIKPALQAQAACQQEARPRQ